ncbi:hypothetical protein APHAL10511_005318 [Amanita phalloides]|nr:hypothetical protein APHAL10511_005318 [Amanita phalloides]
MPTDDRLIICWLYGDSTFRPRTVETKVQGNVYDLKKRIISSGMHPLRHLSNATDIDLWKSPHRLELNMELNEDDRLDDCLELEECFPFDPEPRSARRRIDVIVWYPTPICFCIYGEKVVRTLDVDYRDRKVDELRSLIINKVKLKDVENENIELWKVNVIENELKRLQEFDFTEGLLEGAGFEQSFQQRPQPGYIHILVRKSAEIQGATQSTGTNISAKWLSLMPVIAPSSAAQFDAFAAQQNDKTKAIYVGRPSSTMSLIPTALLHPVFGEFLDNCEQYKPTADDNSFALELSREMSKLIKYEHKRRHILVDILLKHNIVAIPASVGNSTKEPASSRNYQTDGSSEVPSPWRKLPCLLLILCGPYVGFAGAVWQERVIVQILSPLLPLFCHPSHRTMLTMIARHLGAMQLAYAKLKKIYEDNPPKVKYPIRLYPYVSDYPSVTGSETRTFSYENNVAGKLVFRGTDSDGAQICIKFAESYCFEVHQYCADELGIAPKLKGCKNLPGGWTMVIMDWIDERYVRLVDEGLRTPELYGAIHNKIRQLHQRHFVHGDIRDVNIMVNPETNHFYLLDFDWAGELGVVTYPINVANNSKLWRPYDVKDYVTIKAEHDIAMLEHIFRGVDID